MWKFCVGLWPIRVTIRRKQSMCWRPGVLAVINCYLWVAPEVCNKFFLNLCMSVPPFYWHSVFTQMRRSTQFHWMWKKAEIIYGPRPKNPLSTSTTIIWTITIGSWKLTTILTLLLKICGTCCTRMQLRPPSISDADLSLSSNRFVVVQRFQFFRF